MKPERPFLPPDEIAIRIAATDPERNAWVAANAGSGKTSILRDRVIRLLLAGVPADRLLCLTFTRAAAAEMQRRVFGELAEWTALDDAALRARIDRLTGNEPPRGAFLRARRLFAEALETPGGLKIQTIHAFAERLLHLFPIEAGVPAGFAVLDDREAARLKADARRRALDLAAQSGTGLGEAFETLVGAVRQGRFVESVDAATTALTDWQARHAGLAPGQVMDRRAYDSVLGLPLGFDQGALDAARMAALLSPVDLKAIAGRLAPFGAKKPTMRERVEGLVRIAEAGPPAARFEVARTVVLTQKEKIRDGLFVTDARKKLPEDAAALDRMADAVKEACDLERAFRVRENSHALARFSAEVLAQYERAKHARAALDFTDLIEALRRLLQSDAAAWVRLKLDAAIEHVLVDEAQDTNPAMWDIVRALVDDFFAGSGQVPRSRTLFVVGDEKQSIYSFLGAQPESFDAVRREIARQVPPEHPVGQPVRLRYSFRSSTDVLEAVDRVFATPERARGLSAGGEAPSHRAAFEPFEGTIEIWPTENYQASAEGTEADPPAPPERKPAVRVALRIAARIARWLRQGERYASDGQLIRPGDILILVQNRSGPFYGALLRALKRLDVPVAGADRLRLNEDGAVADLMAVARAALLPEDDLALATALRTPLLGWTLEALEGRARGRAGALIDALRDAAASGDPEAGRTVDWLSRQRHRSRALPPFEFLSGLLTEAAPGTGGRSGRQALLERLGRDSAEAIDALLALALDRAGTRIDSLAAFLADPDLLSVEIKRDMPAEAGAVRILTVHGAKGLEARVVFVADAGRRVKLSAREVGLELAPGPAGEVLLWAGDKSNEVPLLAGIRGKRLDRAEDEYRRLLYVALTRAEDRLIVTGFRGKNDLSQSETSRPSWQDLVEEALGAQGRRVTEAPDPDLPPELRDPAWTIRRIGTDPPGGAAGTHAASPPPVALPRVFGPVPPAPIRAPTLRPSGGAAGVGSGLAPSTGKATREEGLVVHRLFEVLARARPADRRSVGHVLLGREGVADAQAEAWLTQTLAALDDPQIAFLFDAASRGEVPIAGAVRLAAGHEAWVEGRIDRLRIESDAVDLLDIKSGRPRAAASDAGILRQMALYRALVAGVYPDRPVRVHVLWSAGAILDTLPDVSLDAAFAAITLG